MFATEEAFQAALDATPDEHTIRLVFADWLDEQGDPRGPGYRAMGRRGIEPDMDYPHRFVYGLDAQYSFDLPDRSVIPKDWYFRKIKGQTPGQEFFNCSRRIAEDMLARKFAKLSKRRRLKLLKHDPVPV